MKKPKTPRPPVMTFLTRQQVAAFYYAIRDGKYKGRKLEHEAVEQMLFAAVKAGVIK